MTSALNFTVYPDPELDRKYENAVTDARGAGFNLHASPEALPAAAPTTVPVQAFAPPSAPLHPPTNQSPASQPRTSRLRAEVDNLIRLQGGTPAPAAVTHHPDGRPRSGLALAIDELVASGEGGGPGPSSARSGLAAEVDKIIAGR